MAAKNKYVVRHSASKTFRALEVNDSRQLVLKLSDSVTYSNIHEFDQRTGVPVPQYTKMLEAALSFAQRSKYPLRNAALIGFAFAKGLHEAIGSEAFELACDLNRSETDEGICHSHDFCDANEVMAAAFESIGLSFDLQSSEDVALWNASWTLAKLRMVARSQSGGPN